MTEGIIQQVIEKHKRMYCKNKDEEQWLNSIQQELIEKIKKEFDFPITQNGDSLFYSDCHKDLDGLKTKLIGDIE